MKIMETSFKRFHACTITLSAPNPDAGHHRPMPPPETPGHSQASLDQSLLGSLLLSPESSCSQVSLCALQESVSPVLWNCVVKSHWPPKSNSLGFSVPLPDPQVGKSVVDPRTFLTVQGFLWYNCFAVCGLSALLLYGGVNGDLPKEGLCHRLCDQVAAPRAPAAGHC